MSNTERREIGQAVFAIKTTESGRLAGEEHRKAVAAAELGIVLLASLGLDGMGKPLK